MSRLDDLQSRLKKYRDEEDKILDSAQEYGAGTRQLKRARLDYIADMIKYLEKEIAVEQAKASGGRRNWSGGVIPRDN